MADSTSPTTVNQNLPKFDTDEVLLFLEGFNASMLGHEPKIWAVAVPVTIRYEGDAQVGTTIAGHSCVPPTTSLDELSPPVAGR
jgi:hypothetical protein